MIPTIRTYYITLEGEDDEIQEIHGAIMKQLRDLRVGKTLSLTVSFDKQNMKKAIGKAIFGFTKTSLLEGGKFLHKQAKEVLAD